ncbi:hypothetical protein TSUD_301810 [Trifolium subterraneum]|uniref:Protein FAR1-RELATED SEQUENCE n=1 Tax=Trifolium subterraneum TaxID=3900 RepID=A0A2Z6NZM8_TRISU|nr:hypothetical protein TSUD_301810 [Trifolium subterraneum]
MEGDDFDVDFESNDDETYLVSSEDESTEDGNCASDNGIDEGDVNVADSLYGKSDSRIREGPEDPVLTTQLQVIECEAAKMYTAALFSEVKHEILKAGPLKEENVDHIPINLVLSRWTKNAKIQYFNNVNCNYNVDSDMIQQARYKKKYCGNDDNERQNSEVGDLLPIPGKGAPKKKKNEPKSVRRCGKCNNPSHNARTCSGKHKMPEQGEKPSVDVDSVSISDSVSQIAEKKKRKASGNGERSLQNKSSHPPKDRSANVGMTTPNGIPSTSGHLHPMYGLQPLMPMVHPMVQPMHVRPMYPMYGMSVGQTSNSCYGLLQQVMRGPNED